MKSKHQILILGASVFSAIAASLCCIGPIVLFLAGATGVAGATLFARFRVPLLGVTIILLGHAWYLAFRARKQTCCENRACDRPRFDRMRKVALYVATVVVIVMVAFPMAFPSFVLGAQPAKTPGDPRFATLHAKIPSMDCPACAIPIRMKLFRQAGIKSVAVTFGSKEIEVQYDPAQVSSEQIVSKLNETGFKVESTNPRKSS